MMREGAYRAIVVGTFDAGGRLRVIIPNVTGKSPVWAAPAWATPDAPKASWPAVSLGDGVWVLFEEGDPSFPVWFGFYGRKTFD